MPVEDTKKKILDLAEDLIRSRGYNGFSYKNISSALGIKNAAIHYHFPTKKDLGVAVIQRTRHELDTLIQSSSDPETPLVDVLDQVFETFLQYVKSGNNICLGGSLQTDFHTLPLEMQQEARSLLSETIQWVKELLSEGRKQGVLTFSGHPEDKAMQMMSSLQGSVQMVRAYDESLFYSVLHQTKMELGL